MFRYCLCLLLSMPLLSSAQTTIERFPKGDADILFETSLPKDGMSDLNTAFALLWLNRDLPQANQHLRDAYADLLKDAPAMTPTIADENAKWQLRTWLRIYYLFNNDSTYHPGRLEVDVQEQMETLFWNYACAKSTMARTNLDYIWLIQDSENHDAMDLTNAFLSVQALQNHPKYQGKTLPDDNTLAAHTAAWTRYYKRYAEERVKYGLLIEIGSPTYGKYIIPEFVNIRDFATDAALRAKMTTLLDVIWADWAMDQINGVRGGGKTRCYQGKYSRNAKQDSYYMMGKLLLRGAGWENLGHGHPIHGFSYILATSNYALPKLVGDVALSQEARGEYAYVSRRPGRMTAPETLPAMDDHDCWYLMKPADSRFLRYSWVTPDYVMGSFLVDPILREMYQVEAGAKEETEARYAAISGQNRWQGIIFSSNLNARVFPQCEGRRKKPDDKVTVTDVQHVAVQHENVLIVQANRASKYNTAMRIYFGDGMKERLQEKDGWYFLEEGNAYLAVKALSRKDGTTACATTWDDANMLRVEDLYTPLIFVTGRRTTHPTLADFMTYVAGNRHAMKNGLLNYQFKDSQKKLLRLSLYANEQRLPEINGQPINLAPKQVYDSPYMKSNFGSGEVMLDFQGKSLVLDVNE